jgi:hypothetical protein
MASDVLIGRCEAFAAQEFARRMIVVNGDIEECPDTPAAKNGSDRVLVRFDDIIEPGAGQQGLDAQRLFELSGDMDQPHLGLAEVFQVFPHSIPVSRAPSPSAAPEHIVRQYSVALCYMIRTPMRILSDPIARLVQAREHLADIANNPSDFNVPVEAIVDLKAIIQHIDELTMQLARAESKSH